MVFAVRKWPIRRWRPRGKKLADDLAAQEKWLAERAQERGFSGIEEFLAGDYNGFAEVAAEWREEHPAEGLYARGPAYGPVDIQSPAFKASEIGKMEFDEVDWIKRVEKANTGQELIDLAMELPDAEIGSQTSEADQESSTTGQQTPDRRST